jgi:hypothetical protein
MYLMTRYAGWGRSFWLDADKGTVDVRTANRHLQVKVSNGIIVEQKELNQKRNERTTLTYGDGLKVEREGRIVKEEFFEPGTLRAIRRGGIWRRQPGISLCKATGTVECYSTSGGAYGKEVFTYDNGVPAYTAAIWRKKLQVNRPNGNRWIVVKGKVHLGTIPIASKLDLSNTTLGVWSFICSQNWGLTVYDTDGTTIITQGQVKNRQKEGRWLENGRVRYYVSGVKVSRKLYEGDPDKWDGYDVLRIPNAQLRCSLLSRMGYDKLLEKVKGRVMDRCEDGGQLIAINTHATDDADGVDRVVKMVRVICPSTRQTYVLRVPPDVKSYEQARQWTFGLSEENLRTEAFLEMVKET